MRQLYDGTWLNEETGVVIAPEAFSYYGAQNDVYSGPPLLPPSDMRNPEPPLGPQRMDVMLPSVRPPGMEQPVAGFPGPQLAVSPFALGQVKEGMKKMLLVAAVVGLTYVTVWGKNRINGKKKK